MVKETTRERFSSISGVGSLLIAMLSSVNALLLGVRLRFSLVLENRLSVAFMPTQALERAIDETINKFVLEDTHQVLARMRQRQIERGIRI